MKILIIEDNPGDARLIQEFLREVEEVKFEFLTAERLSEGIEILLKDGIDVVLLDLSLPDSNGLKSFVELHAKVPDVAIIVLTGLDDSEVGVKAVQMGAQDYLVKGKVDGNLLFRSIRYAVERQRMLRELRALAVTDELTGLYNRRGFLNYGRELLKLGKRMGRAIFLLYADLDGMKKINDNFGHQEGDRALKAASDILKQSFRKADIISRIGGDEFVVLGIVTSWRKEDTLSEILTNRLEQNIENFNFENELPYKLSMSIGVVTFLPDNYFDIDRLLEEADRLMYEQKKSRQGVQ